ncbi:MAG TPA: PAS domain S-box protein, partial [Candidatus Acidoferrum sp.]|nr:PAS domain S-box protein [Candidatus Acidoferrum sp.]
QLLLGLITFVAALRAMRRSRALGRLFWKLSAIAFLLWCFGQGLGVYYGSYLNLSTSSLWFVDIFYVAWPAPLVMCLFLDHEEEPEGAEWRRLLDFGQVAIVFVLLFFYFSALSAQNGTWSAYGLSAVTDGLMTAAFFSRAYAMRGEAASKLFLGIGWFRAVAFLTDLYFVAGLPEYVNGAWFDLIWSTPWLVPLVTAAWWTDTAAPEPLPQSTKRHSRMLLTHVLPLIFPVLVVVTAAGVAPTQLKIAALAVLLSLGISHARLLLTHDALRRSTEAVRNQHEMLNAIVEGTTAAIYVKDLQGRYQLMNSAGVAMVGRKLDEIVGKKDADLFSPESAREIMARDEEMLRSGTVSTYEEEIARDSLTRTFLTTKGPLRDAQGRTTGIVGSSLDVTERYRAIEALAESEERFRTIFDGSPIGMAVISTEGSIVASNPACREMLSLASRDLAGVAIFDELTHPDDRAADAERFRQLIRGEIEYDRREKRYILRDGRRVFADLHLYLVRDKRGSARYVIGISVDITERKSLETQLRQAQRMETIGRLAGGVAHDFNNLLMVIKGYCELLQDQGGVGEGLPQLERISKAADQAASLTQQLLAFSRKQVMQPKVFSLNTLVWNAEKMLSRLISENVEMVTVTARNLGTIKADPGQIEQVILNLVINARDAMPNGGTITLETANIELDDSYAQGHLGAVPGSYVMLSVTDDGNGMDEDTQAHIFEPFFTTKELGKGTGLGLSMVYGIVKQSGGYIWVHSAIGKGSSFRVYLPRVFDDAQELPAPFPASQRITGKETILLVEDDPLVRGLALEILESRGYTILVAERPETALEICRQHAGKIDLVLTDVIMPGMNGRDMADEILAVRPEIGVLFMSGYTDAVAVRNGNAGKVTSFLQKPFSPSVLGRKVREMLDELERTAQKPVVG